MKKTQRDPIPPAIAIVRCAVYTRKSTEEGLNQEFNSLDAQRESAEAYIASQRAEGWVCLPERFDDGGCTGANLDRPALQHLLAAIAAGQVDCVVVYKVDRLSRSLLDFARLMETFEKHQVAFVSVTQQFNTATSMGRLILNVLLSFAQFERELIAERTRDKVAATRRKGKWSGGRPLLGYDVDPGGHKLKVNKAEAVRVRAIFELFLKHEGLRPVVRELGRRRWFHKRWTNRAGQICGGQPFTKVSLDRLLRNVAYVGQVRYQDEVHPGEHSALVSAEVWQRVQALLRRNGRRGRTAVRSQSGALLQGLVRCVPCGCAMVPAHTRRENGKRYGYYVCTAAQKRGSDTCPTKSVAATSIEQVVVEQIRSLGRDPEAIRALVGQISPVDEAPSAAGPVERNGCDTDGEGAAALAACAGEWETLAPQQRDLLVQRLIERVDYDGVAGQVSVTFHSSAIDMLAQEWLSRTQENNP
jgi:site-specific DNA recombinase